VSNRIKISQTKKDSTLYATNVYVPSEHAGIFNFSWVYYADATGCTISRYYISMIHRDRESCL